MNKKQNAKKSTHFFQLAKLCGYKVVATSSEKSSAVSLGLPPVFIYKNFSSPRTKTMPSILTKNE